MTAVIEYLDFISSLFINKGTYTIKDIEKMITTFKNLRPKGRNIYSSKVFDNINITDGLLDESLLKTTQCDSKCHLGVQLADIISGIVQNHFEDAKSEPYKVLRIHSEIKTLYF